MGKELKTALEGIPHDADPDKLRSVIGKIRDLLQDKEVNELREKIQVETDEVKKAKKRLQGLTDNSKDGGPVNPAQTEDGLWRQFELHRSSAMSDICDNSESPTACLTEGQSRGLREIADSAMDVCHQHYEDQQTKLCEALMLGPGEEDKVRSSVGSFQSEIQMEMVPILREKLCQKLSSNTSNMKVETKRTDSGWVLNFDKTKEIKIQGSKCENFMKTCLELCWNLQNNYRNVRFLWDFQGKPDSFKLVGSCQNKSHDRRVYIPAIYMDKKILKKGKCSCVSCNQGNNNNATSDAKGANENTDPRGRESTGANTAGEETQCTGVEPESSSKGSQGGGTTKANSTEVNYPREGSPKSGATGMKSTWKGSQGSGRAEGRSSKWHGDRESSEGSIPLIHMPNTESEKSRGKMTKLDKDYKDKQSAGQENVDTKIAESSMNF